jgi:hypothetical protein
MPVTKITRADIEVMHAWGIKLNEWQRLPEHKRAEYRANIAQVTKACPPYQGVSHCPDCSPIASDICY